MKTIGDFHTASIAGGFCLLLALGSSAIAAETREGPFVRGDADGDGQTTIADAIGILDFLFERGPAADCLDALDADDSGGLDLADGMHLLSFLFSGGSPPPPPHPACGLDRTEDALGCAGQERCAGAVGPALHRLALAEAGDGAEELLAAEPGVKPGVKRGEEDSLDEGSMSLSSRESTALPRLRRGGGGEGSLGTPIVIGQANSGEIRSQTQVDAYVFTVGAGHGMGQWIAVDRLSASSSVLNWKIEDAWGRLLASDVTDLSDLGPVALLGGDYTLSVLPEGTGTGAYEFRIVDAGPEERPLAIGDVVNGAIDPDHPGQRDHYTFAAAAGQTVFLDLISTENSNITWELKDAFGREIVPSRRLGDHGPVGLMGGNYRLTVEGPLAAGGSLATGNYSFRIVGLEPPISEPIVLGQIVDRAITLPGEIDAYSLTVPAGQVVFLDQLASSNAGVVNWELLDGLGRAVLARTGSLVDVGPFALVGGAYELRVLSEVGATATYKLRVTDATATSGPATIGAEISGAIAADRPGQEQVYEFTADAGRRITLEVIQTSNVGGLNWKIEDVQGRSVLARTSSMATTGPIALAGGSYRLTVLGEGDATGTYRFRLRDDGTTTFTPSGTPVAFGEEVPGAIPTPGGESKYTLVALDGRRVYLDLLIGHADLDWEILDPIGRSMELKRANSTDVPDLGPYGLAAGTYTIALRARTPTAAPAFSFRISDAALVVSDAAVGDTVAGSFAGSAGAVHRYRFPASQGQRVFLDRKIASTRLAWTLLDPVGEEVFPFVRGDSADSDVGPFTLAAGTYTLVLDPEFGYQPAYDVAIRAVNDVEDAAVLGVPVQKNFTGQAGSTHTFRIELAEAKRLFFDRITAASRLDWSLIDPAGEAVFGPARADAVDSDQGPFTLSAGKYSLVFDPQYSYEPAYDFRVVEVADTTAPLTFGVPVTGTLGPGGTATYFFDAIEGQRVFIDSETTDGFLRWSLFDELGEAVYRDERLLTVDVDLGPLNLAEGAYRLVVDATASSTPSYAFTAWNVAVDLGFDDLDVSPRVFFAGDLRRDASVTWSVKNNGGGPGNAGPSTDRIVLSTDLVLGNADDILLGEILRFEPLEPHSSYSPTETVEIPRTVSLGTYKLFVILDAEDDLAESGGEDDNADFLDVQVVEDLPPGEPGFITTATFPVDFSASPESLSVDVPLSRPVDLSGVRFVNADALSILLSRPGGIGAQTRITMSLLSGRTEVVEISDVAPSAGTIGLFAARFSRRLSPQLVALLPARTVDGLRFSFDQPSTTRAEIGSIHADGRLRVHFASCEFQPCGPHEERVTHNVEGVTLQGAGTTPWRVVDFAEAVPGDGLRFVSGPAFSATVVPNPFNLFDPAAATSEVQLFLDDGGLLTLEGWQAPSALGNPPGRMLSADHSLALDGKQLAGRRILGFQWRVHIAGASNDASYTPAEPFSVRFLYETEACRGLLDIPPVELSPASGTAFPLGSSVVISGRAVAPQPGRPVSAVLVNGEPVDSLDGAGRFFKTVRVAEGENLFVVQVVEPGCGEYETLFNLRGLKDGASGLSGYGEASAQLKVEYADTTFVRGADTLLVKARVRNVSQHSVRGPILMALANLRPPATELRGAAGITDRGEPYVVLLEGGVLAPGETGPFVVLPLSNPDRVRVQFDVRWLSPANRPPFFESAPPARALAGKSFLYDASASDPDGDPVSFKLDFGPAGMAVDPGTGLLQWTPVAADLGAHDVSLSALDGVGGHATQRWTLVVSGPGTNRPPFFTTAPVVGASVGGAYAYDADAADPDGDPVGYGLLSGPAGLSIDAGSGKIAWSYALPGTHAVSIRAADAAGAEAVQAFDLIVGALPSNPSAPRITTSPSTEAVTGILYVYQPAATDPDGDILSFVLDPAPASMTLDAATGRIRWTPALDQVGQHRVGLSVRDGRGGETRQSFTVVVRDAATANLPPVIESTPPSFGLVGKLLRYDVEALDPEGEPLVFSLATGPAGTSIHAASGVLEWTPKATDVGTHVVGVRATDSRGASGNQVFDVRVRVTNALPQITSENAPGTVLAGTTWQYDLDATDADGDLLRYEISSGPAAMTVQQITGLFTWNTTPADVGVHAIVLRVVDCCGGQAEKGFSIEVLRDDQPPAVAIGFPTFPAPVGSPVEVWLTATDNAGIASRTLTVECAPAATRELRLDEIGRAMFSSSTVGYCTFTATAKDPSGNTTVVSRTLQVGDPDDPLDPHPPVVEILSPVPGSTVTALTTLKATISDATEDGKPGSGPVTWTVEFAPQGSTDFKAIASGSGEKTAAAIGTFDPTLLPNGTYRMRVVGNDTVQTGGIEFDLHVAGELKLGNFTLDVVDLTVPVAGIPIVVSRRYDSLDVSRGDFGAGWRLGLPGRVEDSAVESKTGDGLTDLLLNEPFKPGTRVYVTLTDGRRVGFTFQPRSYGGLFAMFYLPTFEGDPGVQDTLEVVDPAGPFFVVGGRANQVGIPYNPTKYRLVTKGGVKYTIRETGGLERAEDRNGNVLEVRADGIFSSAGPSVSFQRDAGGRIEKIVDPAGGITAYGYDAAGNLVSVTDPTGTRSTYSYHVSPPHYLKEVVEPLGRRSVRADYDAQGRLVSLTNPLGEVVRIDAEAGSRSEIVTDGLGKATAIVYDERGNPISGIDPMGNAASARYDEAGNRIAYTDPRGYTSTAEYDERGNATRYADALGNAYEASYNDLNQIASVTDPLGNNFGFEYDAKGNRLSTTDQLGGTSNFEYDAQGRRISEVDALGNTTRLEYGELGLPIRIIHPDGAARSIEYDALGRTRRIIDESGGEAVITYDAAGRLTSVGDPAGNETILEYSGDLVTTVRNPLGLVTRYEYDAVGRRIRAVDFTGAVTAFAYDAAGRLSEETDPVGGKRGYSYRDDGRLASISNPSGGTTSFEYDPAGNPTSTTHPPGRTSAIEYDAAGRPVAEIGPLGGVRRYAYDALNRRVSATDENGRTIRYAYDGLGRRIQEIDPAGNETLHSYDAAGKLIASQLPGGATTRYVFDALGRLTQVTGAEGGVRMFAYDGAGRIVSSTDEIGNVTTNTYDDLGRLISIAEPLGRATRYAYDAVGNRTAVTDPLGRTWTSTFDGAGRRTSVTDPEGGVTFLEYNPAGSLIAATDPLGQTTEFVYDADGRRVQEIDSLGNAIRYVYDEAGKLSEHINRNGLKRTFRYDVAGRVMEERWMDGDQVVRSIASTYDAAGNRLTASDIESSSRATYDSLNRAIKISNAGTPGAPQVELTYSYDGRGNVISIGDRSGVNVPAMYDRENRLTSLTWTGVQPAPAGVSFLRDRRGYVTEIDLHDDLGNPAPAVRSLSEYDSAARLTGLGHLDGSGSTLAGYEYSYEAADLLTGESHHGQTWSYRYDRLGQLIEARSGAAVTESYSYDRAGNPKGLGYVMGPENRLLEDELSRYAYDAEGSLVRKTAKSSGSYQELHYDHRNRLIVIEEFDAAGSPGKFIRFIYDADDRRIGKVVNGASATWSVIDRDNVWADYDGSGNETARYLSGDTMDSLVARHDATGLSWYLMDRLGTVRDRASAGGALTHHIDYDSFGGILSRTGPDAADRFAFAGREYDEETGLYYNRARYYDPRARRFTTQDPLRLLQPDFNLYRYVGNSPLNGVDPTGMVVASSYGKIAKTIVLALVSLVTRNAATVSVTAVRNGALVVAATSSSVGLQFVIAHKLNAIFGLFAVAPLATAKPGTQVDVDASTFSAQAIAQGVASAPAVGAQPVPSTARPDEDEDEEDDDDTCYVCTYECRPPGGPPGEFVGVGSDEDIYVACRIATDAALRKLLDRLNRTWSSLKQWGFNEETTAKSCNGGPCECKKVKCGF